MGFVPVVDLSEDAGLVARTIDDACREAGFFQIVGHGFDPSVEAALWDAAREFFDLPIDDKVVVAIPDGDAYGYGPLLIERLAASRGDDTPPDLKETFSVGPFCDAPDGLDDPAATFVFSPNRWPSSLPALEPACRGYYDAMAELVVRLMGLMALGLDLPHDFFDPYIDDHTSALRLLHYPDPGGRAVATGQLRAGAHSDYGTLTVLRQDDAPGGLQVRDVEGRWHDVPTVEGAFVVNVGDALERWTNDRWRSTMHRVVLPPADAGRDCSRRSIAFFHNANWDALIECIPTCLGPGEVPRHEPVGAGRHLMDKFRSTQPGGVA
jgi:isopenicillin N synthase-like dioxygenase